MKIRQHEMTYQEKNKIKPPSEGPGPGCLTFPTSVSPSAKRNHHLTSRALRAWGTVRLARRYSLGPPIPLWTALSSPRNGDEGPMTA